MRNRYLARAVILATVVSLTAANADARDREFSSVVNYIRAQYDAKPKGRFLMSFAGLAVKFMHPAGVKSFKLAVFEDLDPSKNPGGAELGAAIRNGLSPEWRPLVQVHSKRRGEYTSIYAWESSKDVELLIVTAEQRAAAVSKASLDR